MKTQENQHEITIIINASLGFFVEQYAPTNIAFPLLPNTYSLWRKYAYKQIQELPTFKTHPEWINFNFYLLSQCHYLKVFIQKVTEHLMHQISTRSIPASIPQTAKIDLEITQKYNHALELHSFYQELFEDVTNLPYLKGIFPEDKKYQLKEELCPDIVGSKEQSKVGQKVKSSLINKGFGIIAEKIFTKTLLFQASTLAIRLNPLSMVASFAFSEFITRYRAEKQGEQQCQKVSQALQSTQRKAQNLKILYEECICLIGPAVRTNDKGQQKLLQMLKQVLIEDWLSIEKTEDDDGWQVIELHDADEFHSL